MQPVIFEREWAQSEASNWTKRGLSKVPTSPEASPISRSTAAGSRGSARRYPGRSSAAGKSGIPPERSMTMSEVEEAPLRGTCQR